MSEATPILEPVGTSSCAAFENVDSCDYSSAPTKRRRYSSPPGEEKAWYKSPLSPPPPPQYCDKNVDACEPDAASVLYEINTGRSILNSTVTDAYNNILKPKLQELVSSSSAHAEAVDDTTKLNINMTSSSSSYPRWPKSLTSPGGINDEVDIAMPSFLAPINLPIRTGPRPAHHASLMHVSSLPVQDRSAQRAALMPRSNILISLSPRRLSQICQEEHSFVPIQVEDEFADEEVSGQIQKTQGEDKVIQILL